MKQTDKTTSLICDYIIHLFQITYSKITDNIQRYIRIESLILPNSEKNVVTWHVIGLSSVEMCTVESRKLELNGTDVVLNYRKARTKQITTSFSSF